MTFKKIILAAVGGIVLAGMLCAGAGSYYIYRVLQDLPRVAQIRELEEIKQASEVFDREGKSVAAIAEERRFHVPLAAMPQKLVEAFLAAEDWGFRNHGGVSALGMLRAAWSNLRAGGVREGGSTITQQLVRYRFLTNERSIERKLREIGLALLVEQTYSKDEILELYLNSIFLGKNSFGVEAASRSYFGKTVQQLTVGEMALLAGLPKAPSRYAPHRYPQRAKSRQIMVLKQMRRAGVINEEEYVQWAAKPIRLAREDGKQSGEFFRAYVNRNLEELLSRDQLRNGGLKIFTTQDSKLQQHTEAVIAKELAAQRSTLSLGMRGRNAVEAAAVVLDPVNGQILALQGGSKFATTQFDRATQSRFEPGFVFVPLMVGVALDAGFTALSPIDESPIGARPGKSSTTIADVLVSGKLDQLMPVFAELGSGTVTGLMQSLGLEDHREVSVIEVARAFATLANRGVPPRLSAITKVEGAEGQVVYDAPQATAEYSFSPQAAMIVRSMLQERKGSKPWIVFVPPTSDPRMAWAVAVRPEAVVAIWVGVDTGPAVLSPARLVKAARRLVTEIADGVAPSRKWEIPAGISYGRFAKGQVPFMSGTEPKTF